MAESALSRSNIRRISPLREGDAPEGSRIPVAGRPDRAAEARATVERGILESRRRQMMSSPAAAPAGRTGDEKYTQLPLTSDQERAILNPRTAPAAPAARPTAPLSPSASASAATSGFRNEVLGGTNSRGESFNPTPSQYQMGGRSASPTSTIPPLLARTQPAAASRPGMIDGRPANRVLFDMEGTAQARGNFGAEIANRNVEKMGVQGAVADYFERNRLDKERNSLPVNEPGNVQEWIKSKRAEVGVTAPSAAGPAQRAMLEARASREQREKDAEAEQRTYDTLRARDFVSNTAYRLGRDGKTPEEITKLNLDLAEQWDRAMAAGGGSGDMAYERKIAIFSKALRSNPADPSSYFKDFTGESDRYNKETGARGLAGARADARGASVMRTPTAGAQLQDFRLALRSEDYVNAATGRVDSSMSSKTAAPEQAGLPLLARPARPVAAAPEPSAPVTRSRSSAATFMTRNANVIRSQQREEKLKKDQEAAALRAQQIQRQRSIPRASSRVM